MSKIINNNTRLRELSGSGFEITDGQSDIRGWDLRDQNGRKIGKVHELIFDLQASKVRYMVVNIDNVSELELEKRRVLVPIGLAELDETDNDVIIRRITPFQLRALPSYHTGTLGAKAEWDIAQVFGREYTLAGSSPSIEFNDNSFYEHEHFNQSNLNNRRNSEAKSFSDGTTTLSEEELRIRQELARDAERERELASLQKDADLGERVSFNHPDELRRFDDQRVAETREQYLHRKEQENNKHPFR